MACQATPIQRQNQFTSGKIDMVYHPASKLLPSSPMLPYKLPKRILAHVIAVSCFAAWPAYSFPSPPKFETDVAPILRDHCVRCHSGNDPDGGIDLSRASGLASGSSDQSIIRPGNSQSSHLIEVVSGDKPEMPKSGKPLSQQQIATLKDWIDAGAPWPYNVVLKSDPFDWWSLRPLARPSLPELDAAGQKWQKTPVDAFIWAKLKEQSLTPSQEVDRRTFIRRVTYDLVGLPPTPSQVDAFVNDTHPKAYENLVETLLSSPEYGERWAQHWLDVAHYGDTHGYDKDKVRPNAWPYRDYVIRSFNEDREYSQFVREQIAGDAFAPDSPDGITGLGFLAAGPFDFVGQIEVRDNTLEKQRVRNIDRDDMVSVTFNTFVSQTAQCARCHDHKFDPIKQSDYYAIQSVFAAIDRADRPYDPDPTIASKRKELTATLERLNQQKKDLESKVRTLAGPELTTIETEIDSLVRDQVKTRPTEYGFHSEIATTQSQHKWVQVDLGESKKISSIVLSPAFDDFANIGAGFGFPLRYRVDLSNDPNFSDKTTLVDKTESDAANPGVAPVLIDAKENTARFVRITATKLAPRQNDFIFALAELSVFTIDGNNVALGRKVSALDSIEAPVRWAKSNLVDGKTPSGKDANADLRLAQLQQARRQAIAKVMSDALRKDIDENAVAIERTSSQLMAMPKQETVYAAATDFATQGAFVATGGKPRTIHVLDRGSESAPKEIATPGTLATAPSLESRFQLSDPDDERARRAALADWIVDKRNPLTWRSIVNRMWSYHFGRGIVESTNDFGRMGAEPSHPELLDYLAVEFRDGKQSIKELHRMIVLSATYRQSSAQRSEPARVDSENRLLWRMNRRKLEAEAIRDGVLMVSGKLNRERGGPSFKPFRFEDDHSPRYLYQEYDPNDVSTHRRSIYRMIVRSVPDPFMSSLDCADPSLSVDRRNETLTALQALSLLNNPFMVRMAEHFADNIKQRYPLESDQIPGVFMDLLQRAPTPEERTLLESIAKSHGLANVCRLLFNANEFLFVD